MSVLTLAAVVCASAVLATGCNAGPSEPQSIGTEDSVNNMKKMRGMYDKAKGDWNALSAEEKAEYTKLAGDDQKAQNAWNMMAGPSGASSGPR